ncbi:MAG: putative heme-binding domain-containing protein [Kiritimatiellia bacterium]|jgi:putative heme-binding domain-containing protein
MRYALLTLFSLTLHAGEPEIVDGFDIAIFAQPPEVNYPVCLTAAPNGDVYVGVDKQGSLGKTPGMGKVVRCRDTDNDGKADQFTDFAVMDHPRGLVVIGHQLWVLHPPEVTLYTDSDGDGVSDESKQLITGISTDYVLKRGADHTTNGIRMGIDGWIYVAVGDFGIVHAVGTDGSAVTRKGGGILRFQPDGTELERYATGTRNICDMAIDPFMNIFTRDNTNDGGGWDVRLNHIIQTAEYGYPNLYKYFGTELMPPLADYGGGSGTGALYLNEPGFPKPYDHALITMDWGKSQAYYHALKPDGASFHADQANFASVERITDGDVDGSERLYLASWRGGKFKYDGEEIGYVAIAKPKGWIYRPFENLGDLDEGLVAMLASPSATRRFYASREIIRRGVYASPGELTDLAMNQQLPLEGRVAAIFTLKQQCGRHATHHLVQIAEQDAVREWALRALTDRKGEFEGVPVTLLVKSLNDPNPRVRAAAIIGIGRLGELAGAQALVPLTTYTGTAPLPPAPAPPAINKKGKASKPGNVKTPPFDSARVLPHLAVKALAALDAWEVCVASLNGPHRDGALLALSHMHNERAVGALIKAFDKTSDLDTRKAILVALMRLYHQEKAYTDGSWWGTRPDTRGPYYHPVIWSASAPIEATIRKAAKDPNLLGHIQAQLPRHRMDLKGLTVVVLNTESNSSKDAAMIAQALEASKADGIGSVGNMSVEDLSLYLEKEKGSTKVGKLLFLRQACISCHTTEAGQALKGPHLVGIGQRYNRDELAESMLHPNAKISQGFATQWFKTKDGTTHMGFVTNEASDVIELRNIAGVASAIKTSEIAERGTNEQSMMPPGLTNSLSPKEFASLIAYLESLKE